MAKDVLGTRCAVVGHGTVPGDSGGCSVPDPGVAAEMLLPRWDGGLRGLGNAQLGSCIRNLLEENI